MIPGKSPALSIHASLCAQNQAVKFVKCRGL